jgi:hypothetical protein
MSWEAGLFLLAEGASVTVEFWWPGQYMGPQYAMARPLMEISLGLGSEPIIGERTVNTSGVGLTGRREDAEEPADWIYHVTVQNVNTEFAVFFTLTGGGV